MIEIIVTSLLIFGMFFIAVAAIGFYRLPDVYCRLHVTGMLDSLGAPAVLLAMAIYLGPSLTSAKLILMILLIYLTSPLIGHLLSRAALEDGYRPLLVEEEINLIDENDEETH
ncbi:monovalent cation/H(+) antiporter subunit G [bacterium]|nr:monovalent cation/H(+) antiporter subunit G [bacterium]